MNEQAIPIPTPTSGGDKGARVGVGVYNLNVALRFDKPVELFTLTPEQAHRLGRQLMKTGKRVTKLISQRKRELARKAAEK